MESLKLNDFLHPKRFPKGVDMLCKLQHFAMVQTNYRICFDKQTNERCVLFLGTTLDSWTLAVPLFLWNLPWCSGEVKFDYDFDESRQIYSKYKMTTDATWAPASVELAQTKDASIELASFPDTETGLVYLTHLLAGFYYRRDGKLGTYRVWCNEKLRKPHEYYSQ